MKLWLMFVVIATIVGFFNDITEILERPLNKVQTSAEGGTRHWNREKPLAHHEEAEKARNDYCEKHRSVTLCRPINE